MMGGQRMLSVMDNGLVAHRQFIVVCWVKGLPKMIDGPFPSRTAAKKARKRVRRSIDEKSWRRVA